MASAPVLENFMGKLLAPEIFYLDSATFTERGSLTQQVDTMCIISTSYNKMIPDEFVLDNYLHLYLGKVQLTTLGLLSFPHALSMIDRVPF